MKLRILALMALLTVGAGCAERPQTTHSDKPIIATTIIPLTSMVKNMVGDAAVVQSILPQGAEPHDVVLSPNELITLQKAKVVVKLGLGLDEWVNSGVSATNSATPIITASSYLNLPPGVTDPHVWLSPKRMLTILDGLEHALQEQLPDARDEIARNTANYRQELQQLDARYQSLAKLRNKNIVTLHDAFGYLAQDYGLTIVGVVQDLPEDSPTPQQVVDIIKTLKRYPVAPLFGESEIHPAILDAIAKDTGRRVYALDAVESGVDSARRYVDSMVTNHSAFEAALGQSGLSN